MVVSVSEIQRAVEIYRTSTSNILGSGHFGTAHYIATPEGPAVLKILRTKPRKGMDENEEAVAILANLKTLKPLLPPSFVPLLHIPQTGAWYVRGYAPGETVSKQLPELTRHQKQEISHAYGAMLKQAHANDIIIGSTGWDDFVWDGKNGKLVDYENTATITDAQIPWHISRTVNAAYAAREQLLANARVPLSTVPAITPRVDVESFALLLDHLYNGTKLRETRSAIGWAQEAAKKNLLQHPVERLEALPPKLREPVNALCSYPRNEKVTLDELLTSLQ